MLLFKKILTFSKEAVATSDKRQAERYPVGQTFPFKPVLTLIGHDGEGNALPESGKSQDWAGRLSNISATGASIQIHSAAVGARGEPCVFKLSLDGYLLEIPGTIAFFRFYPQYALCGFSFNFHDFEIQKAYLQILEPVTLGASLAAVDPKKIKQDIEGLTKEQYVGDKAARLTVWRDTAGGINSFEFRMNDYCVRWAQGMTEVQTGAFDPKAAGKKGGLAMSGLTPVQKEEVHWLFCLAVPNLAKAVPMDVRKFLGQMVAVK
ncbi:MAG: PilZ domain-containing protein [Opitutae bacterium]|nr:PilZ domain-containing protein [Opitutae bacterium]